MKKNNPKICKYYAYKPNKLCENIGCDYYGDEVSAYFECEEFEDKLK